MQGRSVVVVPSDGWGWREVPSALEELPGVDLVGTARSVGEARGLAGIGPPDAVVATDRLDGRSIMADLVALRPLLAVGGKLVVLAEAPEAEAVAALDDFALDGLFLWSHLTHETLPLVLAATLLTDMVAGSRDAVRVFLAARRRLSQPSHKQVTLTDRERTVLRGLLEDLPRAKIAVSIGVSKHTIDRDIADLQDLLGATNGVTLGYRAAELGLP
jgi:DNA-binding NarL/FixJ family response regulator